MPASFAEEKFRLMMHPPDILKKILPVLYVT